MLPSGHNICFSKHLSVRLLIRFVLVLFLAWPLLEITIPVTARETWHKQVEGTAGQVGDAPNQISTEVQCLEAQNRVRQFRFWSWAVTLILAYVLYWVALKVFHQRLTSLMVWIMAPIIASLIVATILSYREDQEFTTYCSELSSWRIDSFFLASIRNFAITILVFGAHSLIRYRRLTQRLSAIRSN
jgi:hypothetical protein